MLAHRGRADGWERDFGGALSARMTSADAERLQDGAWARGVWLMWFVSTTDPEHPGKAVAWAIAADPHGGTRLPGVLVADTRRAARHAAGLWKLGQRPLARYQAHAQPEAACSQ